MYDHSMSFGLGEDIEALRDAVRQFVSREIAPIAAAVDDRDHFPLEIWRKLGELGVLGMTVSGDYGGTDLGYLAHIVAMEEIVKTLRAINRYEDNARTKYDKCEEEVSSLVNQIKVR